MPCFPATSCQFRRHRAFTVTELLVVIGVMAILLTITINIGSGIAQQSMVTRARSELAGIGQALAQYKVQFGDYPQTDQEKQLYDALTGKLGPGPRLPTLTPPGKIMLNNLSQFTVTNPDKLGSQEVGQNSLLDPWGNPYHYIYKKQASNWVNSSYVLFSSGPDGKYISPPINSTGFIQGSAPTSSPVGDDADNIYEPAIQ